MIAPIDTVPSGSARHAGLVAKDLVYLMAVQGFGVIMIREVAYYDDPRGRFMPETMSLWTLEEIGYSPKLR